MVTILIAFIEPSQLKLHVEFGNLIYLVFIKPTGKIRKENIKRICFFNFTWFWENLILELFRVSFRASWLGDWITKIIPSGFLTFISKVSAEISYDSTINHTKQCILIIVTYSTVYDVVCPSVVPRSSKQCGPETYIWNKNWSYYLVFQLEWFCISTIISCLNMLAI